MGYLKALGVLRLLDEQADPDVQLSWKGETACLHTTLNRAGILDFFLSSYKPTPIIAPWNGGSGFYGTSSAPLEAIESASNDRLRPYLEVIRSVREFLPAVKPKDEEKTDLLLRCRSELPDEILPWLDACFVLGEDRPAYFPLVGTGGNDGRLDFTINFMQRLGDVLTFDNATIPEKAEAWLACSLFGDSLVELAATAVGQFNPGGIGGANATQGSFEADSRVNPWDFILMIEGLLAVPGSVARRLNSSGSARAVFPFTVDSIAAGYGSAAAIEETKDGSRAEFWLPLWERPFSNPEVRHLFAEGRAQIGKRQAANSVEIALAVNLLGIARGVTKFKRYGFLKRNGLAYLAAPLGNVAVSHRPVARLLNDPALVQWVDRLRSACRDKKATPSRYQTALHDIDQAALEFANRSQIGNDPPYLVNVLRAIGRAERTLAGGLSFCKDKYLSPLQGLRPQWLTSSDDGSAEFALAAALAGIKSPHMEVGPIRTFLEKVEARQWVKWTPESASAVWTGRPFSENLAATFYRRMLECSKGGLAGMPVYSPCMARPAHVLQFLTEHVDEQKLEDLLWALIGVDSTDVERPTEEDSATFPFEFGILRLVLSPLSIRWTRYDDTARWTVDTPEADRAAEAAPDLQAFQSLRRPGRSAVEEAVNRAALRLKSRGLIVNGYRNRQQSGKPLTVTSYIKPHRLAAAMLFPLSYYHLARITQAVLYPPESEE
jgi:CRISPR-associated protein Csx17